MPTTAIPDNGLQLYTFRRTEYDRLSSQQQGFLFYLQ